MCLYSLLVEKTPAASGQYKKGEGPNRVTDISPWYGTPDIPIVKGSFKGRRPTNYSVDMELGFWVFLINERW